MRRNTTADRFRTLCGTCRHFNCVINRSNVKYCTYKGRPVGYGIKCSKYKDAQRNLNL